MNVTVRRGDCLWAIAQEHGVSLKALIAANPQIANPSLIYPGQTVHLPGGSDAYAAAPLAVTRQPLTSLPATTANQYQAHAVQYPETIFKCQVRDGRYNPTGPLTSGNCGPTTLAMAIKAYGLEPAGLTPEQSIDRARYLMTHEPGDHDHESTTNPEREIGAARAGLHVKDMRSMRNLDAELSAGHMIMLNGEPVGAYRTAFPSYIDFYGMHSILVVGRASDGRYVVCDPLTHYGPRKMTRAQLSAFWSQAGGSGAAVWR